MKPLLRDFFPDVVISSGRLVSLDYTMWLLLAGLVLLMCAAGKVLSVKNKPTHNRKKTHKRMIVDLVI